MGIDLGRRPILVIMKYVLRQRLVRRLIDVAIFLVNGLIRKFYA